MKRKMSIVGIVLALAFLLCSCAHSAKMDNSYGKANSEGVPQTEANIHNINGKAHNNEINTETSEAVDGISEPSTEQYTSTETKANESSPNPNNLPTQIEYGFIDYTEFTQYWNDGVFRCGTDFAPGTYFVLPLYGAGAIYDVADSPNDFSWSYYRLLREVTVESGKYVNICDDAIMVPAEEVDTDDLTKYGVFLVGRDVLAGEYLMESIYDEYQTDLNWVTGIHGAYQLNDHDITSDPIECGYLFDSQNYIRLENGQYITLTNMRLTNVDVAQEKNQLQHDVKKNAEGISESDNCPIQIVAQEFTGTKYGFSYVDFTVKNVSGTTINTLTLDIKILDENRTVLETTHPQEGVLIEEGESIIFEALTDADAYAMKLDGYSYWTSENHGEEEYAQGHYIQGYFSNTEPVVLSDATDEGINTNTAEDVISSDGSNDLEEAFTSNGCFTYTPRSFMERFDEADKELDGYNYAYMRVNGEENLYYELADIQGSYENVESIGMVSFTDSSGSSLSIDDDFTENIIGSITILSADIEDVPALLICSMCSADPSLDFTTAYNIGEDVIKYSESVDGYTYNGVNYVITEDTEYYFIIISVDTSVNIPSNDSTNSVETTEYELNFAEFCVPNSFEHTDTDGNVMWFQNGETNRIMVEIEKVPDYMKIDTGSDTVISATKDVVDFYIYDYEDDVISEGWVRIGKHDCYEKVFSVETDTGVRKGRSIVVPVNETERVIVLHALCEDEEYLSAVDIIIESVSY